MKKRSFIAGLLFGVAGLVSAATFNLFSPATGILKGNSSTYVTTAAASSDVIGLWTGTCNSSTFLKGDGACGSAGTGTVTSVGLTMPTGFSVGGSPVTGSGTLAVTTTLNGVLHGNGSAFTAGNVALGSEVSGTLPVSNGGIGVGTLTGIAKGNGTSAFTAAVSSDVIGLWSGTCNNTTFLRGDGSCQTPGGGGTVTSVGLTMPSGFSVGGSPVTGSGTLAVTTTLNGVLHGNGSAFTAGNVALGSEVSGTLPVGNGGSGATTLTGVLHGNGSSAFTAGNVALASEVAGTLPVGNGGTGTTTATGSGSVVLSASPALTGTPTVGGVNVCLQDGTNCPSSSGPFTLVKTSATSRNTTTTLTADPTLTTTSLTAGKIYAIEVMASWDQGGATTNGLQADITTNGASAQMQGLFCFGSANTSVANASVTGNQAYQSVGGPFSQTTGSGGSQHQLICKAVADFTSCASGCGVNFRWAQANSDATNTRVNIGSYLTATPLN